MANNYCRHLSNSARFFGKDLRYQPCCEVPASPPITSTEQLNQYRIDITNLVLENKEKYCQPCIKREQSGSSKSLRQLSFKQIPEDATDGDIVDLSIQIDTTCNAACTICVPEFSSLWRKELIPLTPLEDTKHEYVKLTETVNFNKLQLVFGLDCIKFFIDENREESVL
jgi:hypothetical protein